MWDNLKSKYNVTDEEIEMAINQINFDKCDSYLFVVSLNFLYHGDIPREDK